MVRENERLEEEFDAEREQVRTEGHAPAPAPVLSPAPGYNARENARIARMRHYIGSCEVCESPIYEDPGHCVQCVWGGGRAAAAGGSDG